MTLIGLIISLGLLLIATKPHSYYWIYYFRIAKEWGGFSSGIVFVRDITSWDKVNEHEFGHTMQNTLLGPFAIFLCYIPSMVRYFIRNAQQKQGKELKPYDSVWFEASATDCGEYLVNYLKEKKQCKTQMKD